MSMESLLITCFVSIVFSARAMPLPDTNSFGFAEDKNGEKLQSLLLAGSKVDRWNEIGRQIGEFLGRMTAEMRLAYPNEGTNLASNFKEQSKMLSRLRNPTNVSVSSFDKEKYASVVEWLNSEETVAYSGLTTENVLIRAGKDAEPLTVTVARDEHTVPVIGPIGADLVSLMADLIVQYGQTIALKSITPGDHRVLDVYFAAIMDAIGNGYTETLDSKNVKMGENFWSKVALATGFETLRGCVEKENVQLLIKNEYGLADCTNSGSRLISASNNVKDLHRFSFIAFTLE